MTREQQQEMIKLIEQYENDYNREIVRANLQKYIKPYKLEFIADSIGVGIHAIYQYTRKKGNKPSFYTALQLCELLDITIDELLKENNL